MDDCREMLKFYNRIKSDGSILWPDHVLEILQAPRALREREE